MGVAYPSLDTNGWINDPSQKMIYVLNDYFDSNFSQTIEHYGKIKSLPFTISQFNKDRYKLGSKITDDMNALYNRYFDNATVNVIVDEETRNGKATGLLIIKLSVSANEGISVYRLAKVLNVSNNKILSVVDQ